MQLSNGENLTFPHNHLIWTWTVILAVLVVMGLLNNFGSACSNHRNNAAPSHVPFGQIYHHSNMEARARPYPIPITDWVRECPTGYYMEGVSGECKNLRKWIGEHYPDYDYDY